MNDIIFLPPPKKKIEKGLVLEPEVVTCVLFVASCAV